MDVYEALAQQRASGRTVVLVTVLDVEGEAASRPGAKLVATADAVLAGTLGCSEFDAAAIELAREALSGDRHVRRRLTFAGEPSRSLDVFAEVHVPEAAVVVLGATPVGRALAELAGLVGRRAVLVEEPGSWPADAPPGPRDAVVVTDHEAPWVDTAVPAALAGEAFFVGMLGSRRHAPAVVARLGEAGVPSEHLHRLRTPVGLDIGSRTAPEIALSIMAEIVAAERGRPGSPLRLTER